MAFFRKKEATNSDVLKINEVKVATTRIVSSYNDGSGLGPKCVKWYFLVREIEGNYYEIFSNRQIKKETDSGFISQNFDTPFIEKLEPLTDYLRNPQAKVIKLQLLFDFILDMNVEDKFKIFYESEEED